MTKEDFVKALMERNNLTRQQASDAVTTLAEAAITSLAFGKNIYLRNFGTFRIERRATKKALNIQTKETVIVPAHNVVKFIPCKQIKEAVK